MRYSSKFGRVRESVLSVAMRVRIIVLDYVSENWCYHPIYLCFYQILCFVVLLVLFSSFRANFLELAQQVDQLEVEVAAIRDQQDGDDEDDDGAVIPWPPNYCELIVMLYIS